MMYSSTSAATSTATVLEWSTMNVIEWAQREKLSSIIINCIESEDVDGRTLLALTENDIRDLRYKLNYELKFGDIKNLWLAVRTLQKENATQFQSLIGIGIYNDQQQHSYLGQSSSLLTGTGTGGAGGNNNYSTTFPSSSLTAASNYHSGTGGVSDLMQHLHENDRISPPLSVDGRATSIPPEFFKTFISLGYSFLVTWITAFVMVVVHERVPDMKRYPPLPDIFLDNVPHIPWAFNMCEITGTILFTIWSCVCIFHKYRTVLLRRFFGIAGTVFLLRCVTMLITSLSVPGTHLQCNQNDYKVDDTNLTISEALELRISRAYTIWSGLGMSIQGVRTCGDYMFSGHTVALTLLNFFITEYTPRNLYFLHTMTWLLNMFGIFFILAAHEHYSIDVFVAFYITSRLFLYYHTLANNQALMSHDSNRTRIWFPMFSYFESSVDGIIPNEYENLTTLCSQIFSFILTIKDSIMLTTQRFWIQQNQQIILNNQISNLSLNSIKSSSIHNFKNNQIISADLLKLQQQQQQKHNNSEKLDPLVTSTTTDNNSTNSTIASSATATQQQIISNNLPNITADNQDETTKITVLNNDFPYLNSNNKKIN